MSDGREDVLRRVLEAEAAKVEVRPDALAVIRARTARRGRWLPFGAIALTAATATAATLVVVALGGSPAPDRTAPDPGAVTAPATTPAPATSAPETSAPAVPPPSRSSASSGTSTASLAVYYVGDDGGKPRLYREFHRLPAGDGSPAAKVRAAVTEMLTQESADDPDYASAWPAGVRVEDVSIAGSAATVHLSAAPPDDLAGQQLVWTVAAVLGGDPRVRLVVGDRPAGTLRKAPALDTLASLWLIGPGHGATVARTFEVHAAGAVFEATARLTVRAGRTVVTEKTITLSAGAPARGEARITLTLAPGTYVLELYALSAADGSVQHLDDHTVTVR
ncbi:Gmad2 immunoglobulin-like domain-containing protein [Phytohabitans kaempferiae]|uniref:Gmad2 immunoglobulin-like domain-containing protein n=1 Tax=Phytohabitans kaempferiae TaxID=1620943 RepID=A0ABV6M223_9ACTN